jgi:hypothetical protein
MSATVIQVEGLSKRYQRGAFAARALDGVSAAKVGVILDVQGCVS